jgi:hypothetical protein
MNKKVSLILPDYVTQNDLEDTLKQAIAFLSPELTEFLDKSKIFLEDCNFEDRISGALSGHILKNSVLPIRPDDVFV